MTSSTSYALRHINIMPGAHIRKPYRTDRRPSARQEKTPPPHKNERAFWNHKFI
ncbi:unnamed protein product [Amoebophrya sp. A120]|nr:unnamed protein product [Amoebophrya sp. A120]|eukprot:GSA120T00018159001.1